MLREVYRICPKCGTSNDVSANFCLKCGNKLTTANEKPLIKHGGRFSTVLDQLDLTDKERTLTTGILITKDNIPVGNQFEDTVYAEATVKVSQGIQLGFERLAKHLYSTLVSLEFGGVANLTINSSFVPEADGTTMYLVAYGDGFKKIDQHN
ncbi:zinc ribbon domain-containing protein [Lentilactobacillus kisonensis]|uniref:Zinc-ribbon domain-containing protein n=2 Tax=Lentilactobacillus kisonensis TaxID=481722 RepID=H1LGV1_9LACO|nr:zinc ribbon domain-containing protein [Lentilactobacillus kisonensis]EHO50731.1 hypothetical protein HMPREF9104_01830 [Lentilactobacillus kisonensis F0435]KRL21937.1 hypothetical protein FC98_GL000499 [Lentilactobacillus kisonensis DSM 19906 = JCM 15041]